MFSAKYFQDSGLVTFAEAAILSGLKVDCLRRWADRGYLPIAHRSAGRVFLYFSDLKAVLEKRRPDIVI